MSFLLHWTASANRDMVRLHDFLKQDDPRAAARIMKHLVASAKSLLIHPQLGNPLEEFTPRNVRHLIVQDYELRYELSGDNIYILRLWHCREDR